jgi:hypothetical protein
MTLKDAEKIVQEFGAVLAEENPDDGPALYESSLRNPRDTIVQAMKLWLAYEIKNRSLTEEFRNMIGTAAHRLPFYIEDNEARRLNEGRRGFSPAERIGLSEEDFDAREKAAGEAHEWALKAATAGLGLRLELRHLVAAVEKLDPADSLFWQRVYTLAALEYSPIRECSFGD